MTNGMDSVRNVVDFIETYIKLNELGRPFHLFPHQKEVLRLAFQFDDSGRLPYDTIIYSCCKKDGKTTINGAVTGWWGFTQEAPNELLILANDLEQAQARTFTTLVDLIKRNPELASSAKMYTKYVSLSNGSTFSALASEYEGSAGSNHGYSSWDELWAYDTKQDHRLWEELTPVPTRKNSIRFITTYAGFENESSLLRGLYLLGVGTDEHPEGKGERLHPTLPIYANREARVFCYWDHEPRMPWQTEAYRAAQRRTLRPNSYVRLHENRWIGSEARFITPDLYESCTDPSHRPLPPWPTSRTDAPVLCVGVDAAIKHDNAAVVAVSRIKEVIRLELVKIWAPTPEAPLNLESTIESYLRELRSRYLVRAVYADPWQMQSSIQRLSASGLRIEEFPQTVPNQTRAGQLLYDLFTGRNIRLFPHAGLRTHVLNCVSVESARGWRLAKEKNTRKIDAAVALSMACVAAVSDAGFAPAFEVKIVGW
jgi:phage terminase large subunit-like protein